MNTTLVRRSTILAAACLAALVGPGVASAAPAQKALEALSNRGPASDLQLPSHARAQSGVLGVLNSGALSASALELTLADGSKATARLQRVARDDKKGVQSWVGTFDDAPGSVLVLSKAKGVVSGFANYGTEVFEILPQGNGKHLLFAVDSAKVPKTSEPISTPIAAADSTSTTDDFGLGGSTLAAADGSVVQDLLVVYTASAAAKHGQATLESMIVSAVQAANQAYANSSVAVTLNLAGLKQVALTEGGTQSESLHKLKDDAEVTKLRELYGADMVALVGENSNNCGQAWVMQTVSTSHAAYAYGSVYSSCLSGQTLAHEIGHVQGLMHDRDSSSYGGAYPYSYGYRVCASDGTGFRDIMSYACTGAPRVLLFSTPYKYQNGHAAGIAYETNAAQSAENARSLNNTATTVAAFRGATSTVSPSPTTAPTAPSGLAVQSAAYNQVKLAWADNSANETGFKLDRSADGVSFSEIATLGTDSRTYTDPAVTAKTTYFYRVRAYNSAGTSGYSSTVNVTTPDAPPPPPPAPTSVAAVNNGNGSATVSWSTGSTNATSFEVRREKWDSQKGTWTGAMTAATVPSSVLSIVDASGTGTYRYSVRGSNTGGFSAYAGPTQVIVTSTTSTTSTKKAPRGRNK